MVYGITSRGRTGADAARLLGLVRGHWGIENGLHYVRDEARGEERCRVRKGKSPPVLAALAALGNVAVQVLAGVKARRKAAATRRLAAHPEEALPLLLL